MKGLTGDEKEEEGVRRRHCFDSGEKGGPTLRCPRLYVSTCVQGDQRAIRVVEVVA